MATKNIGRVTNKLIDSLPAKERLKLLSLCEDVDLTFGEVLYTADQPIDFVYLPLRGFISMVSDLEGHEPLEMGLIGNEGMLGASLILGIKKAPMGAVVQGSGTALRLTATQLIRQLRELPALSRILGNYLYVVMAQLTQSAACTRFHEIEPRLARWLLLTHDRAHADHFYLTHAFLAGMLGVRRSGVSIAAGALQLRELISYSRGDISILDRSGLEAASCECYRAMVLDYSSVFA